MREGKPTDAIGMLKEIEAYLTFRLLCDAPSVPASDMQMIKDDINEVLILTAGDGRMEKNE